MSLGVRFNLPDEMDVVYISEEGLCGARGTWRVGMPHLRYGTMRPYTSG